jgi:cytidine deaminase
MAIENKQFSFDYQLAPDISALDPADAALLQTARQACARAYAPYSAFLVGAAARMAGGTTHTGTNQENASYPVGICAERVLLSAVSGLYPEDRVETIAVSYHNTKGSSDQPISPCGICRQTLLEYQDRGGHPIRLIMSGQTGAVMILNTVTDLMPMAFMKSALEQGNSAR